MKYTCENCKGEFETEWSDVDAEAEYINNFPKHDEKGVETAIVCDDCYEELLGIMSPKQAESLLDSE